MEAVPRKHDDPEQLAILAELVRANENSVYAVPTAIARMPELKLTKATIEQINACTRTLLVEEAAEGRYYRCTLLDDPGLSGLILIDGPRDDPKRDRAPLNALYAALEVDESPTALACVVDRLPDLALTPDEIDQLNTRTLGAIAYHCESGALCRIERCGRPGLRGLQLIREVRAARP